MAANFPFERTRLIAVPRDPLRFLDTAPSLPEVPARRSKIWELSSTLHCSIIGTCLTTAALRQLLVKLKLAAPGASDHDLHGQGVLLAGRHDGAGKLLNKLLDQEHRAAIRQFEGAASEAELRQLWRAALQRGEIPDAYWAVLSHPLTASALVREVFGEVHMLSHLVGAANRADIRQLCRLEAEKAELEAKIRRQEARLREDITARDTTIAGLNRALAGKLADADPDSAGDETLAKLVADLERRLGVETKRRERAETRLATADAARQEDMLGREAAEQREAVLRAELETLEARLPLANEAEPEIALDPADLFGLTLLYVGGRPTQLAHLKALGERMGAEFLHHDGGIEDRGGLLAGLVSRADLVMFPVDCVSHEAMLMVKRLCRHGAKPFLPLRSAGVSSFLTALGRPEFRALATA